MSHNLSNASVLLAITTLLSFLLLVFLALSSRAAAIEPLWPLAVFGGASAIGLGLSTPGRG